MEIGLWSKMFIPTLFLMLKYWKDNDYQEGISKSHEKVLCSIKYHVLKYPDIRKYSQYDYK